MVRLEEVYQRIIDKPNEYFILSDSIAIKYDGYVPHYNETCEDYFHDFIIDFTPVKDLSVKFSIREQIKRGSGIEPDVSHIEYSRFESMFEHYLEVLATLAADKFFEELMEPVTSE